MRAFIIAVVTATSLLVTSVTAQQLLVGGSGLSHQVDKYLLDQGYDPVKTRLARQVVVKTIEGGEALVSWELPIPAPTSSALDPVSDSFQVVTAPTSRIKKVNGKYVLKTQAELDAEFAASPEGVRKTKRNSVRAQLRTELTTAGFTNAVYTLDDVQTWLETATLATGPEKKINRLVSQLQSLSLPTTPVSANE